MRELEYVAAGERMRWLTGIDEDNWAYGYRGGDGATGYDRPHGWPAVAWVLHASWQWRQPMSDVSYNTVSKLHDDDPGARVIVEGVDVEPLFTVRDTPGLFRPHPGPRWRRIRWAELAQRDGFRFDAVTGHYLDLVRVPHTQWSDIGIPLTSWPDLDYTEAPGWPIRVLPPPDGSLDDVSLHALVEILGEYTDRDARSDSVAYFSATARVFQDPDLAVYVGDLDGLPDVVVGLTDPMTPNNLLPGDQSWLLYTDCDLRATRICGSRDLIAALHADERLDTVCCTAESMPYPI